MTTLVNSQAALRALHSMQQLLSRCPPLPGARSCRVRPIQLRAFSADAPGSLAREEAPGSVEMASRNARVFSQVSRMHVSRCAPNAAVKWQTLQIVGEWRILRACVCLGQDRITSDGRLVTGRLQAPATDSEWQRPPNVPLTAPAVPPITNEAGSLCQHRLRMRMSEWRRPVHVLRSHRCIATMCTGVKLRWPGRRRRWKAWQISCRAPAA